jgi:hypothetical protein
MSEPKKVTLYIDGENLKYYIKKISKKNKKDIEIERFDFKNLFSTVLSGIDTSDKRFYFAIRRR